MRCKYYDGFWGGCYNTHCPRCAKECTYENQEECGYFQSDDVEMEAEAALKGETKQCAK